MPPIENGRAYYFSPSGNDSANGISPQTAFRSLAKIDQLSLRTGDSILLEGNHVFPGNIRLEKLTSDSPGSQLIITTYGKGKATINAGTGTGIFVSNLGRIKISNLVIQGNGVETNLGNGIHFYTDQLIQLQSVSIEHCEVTGFHNYGILFQGDKSSSAGFTGVNLVDCRATLNGEAGIGSLSAYPAISHRQFIVRHCIAFNNRGIATKTDNHSGNGIVLSGVGNFLIDSCEAFENGLDCRSIAGGPVGIWVWNCRNGTIQNSHSHHNHAGTSLHDGGGFDIDGGSSGCTIRSCISNDNEGAGYLVCEFGSPNKFENNRVTGNTSINDGLKNGYGAITISGAGPSYPVTKTVISDNRVVVQNKGTRDGVPAGLYFVNGDCAAIQLANNHFELSANSLFMRTDSLLSPSQVRFKDNQVKAGPGRLPIRCDKCKPGESMILEKIVQQ